jgi:hypothetical protein
MLELINNAANGSTVVIPAGTYEVNPVPCGVNLDHKSDVTVDLTGVTIKAQPTDQTNSIMMNIYGSTNITILNGHFIGERDTHLGSTAWDVGGWGNAIRVGGGSKGVKIRGVRAEACFGDGIYIDDGYDVEIDHCFCDRNRRQGMSVIHADGVHVHDSVFCNSGGTPPGCGIDWECDLDTQRIANVLIERNKFYGNQGSGTAFGSAGTYTNIRVMDDNEFDHKTQPIYAAGHASPLGTPWYAFLLNRTCSWMPGYRWWGYPTSWYHM